MTSPPTAPTIGARRGALDAKSFVRSGIGYASAGAGVIHFLAAREHFEHPVVAAFFALLAVAQLLWGLSVTSLDKLRLLRAGVALNAGVIAVWLFSRTVGFGFVPGLEGREAVGFLDVTATLAEVAIVAGGLYLVAPAFIRGLHPRDLAVSAAAVGVVALALPPVIGTPIGGHVHAEVHEHDAHALASGHVHESSHAEPHAKHAAHDSSHAGDVPHRDRRHMSHDVRIAHRAHAHAAPTSATSEPPPVRELRGAVATIRYGPFTLEPATVQGAERHPVMSNVIRTKLATPCTDCYLTAMEPDLVYADGSSANFDTGAMLHHAVIGDSAQRDLTCGRNRTIGWMGRRFFASGNERTKGVLPAPFGYRVGSGDWWTGIFEIMNFEDTPQTVWFEMTVRYLPASDSSVKPVTPVWLDVDNCNTSVYSIPAGRSTTTWDWRSSVTGRVVFAGGHVHDWGRRITLSNATTGERMCKSVAGYGSKPAFKGNIESMTTCVWDRIGSVREGELLRIAAYYESPEARDDVMGIMMAYVYETNDLSGGTRAPESVRNPSESRSQPHPSHDH